MILPFHPKKLDKYESYLSVISKRVGMFCGCLKTF